MTNVTDLLRQADPLNEDPRPLDDARASIRRTVVAAASDRQSHLERTAPRRRVVMGVVGAFAAALVVVGVLFGAGNQGALSAAVRFEAHLAEAQPAPGLVVAQVGNSGRLIYLHPEAVVTNEDIAQSWVVPDGADHYSVSVLFQPPGAQRLQQATAVHIGRPVAILIDGKVALAPVVRSAISNAAMITGDYSRADAERIAEGIGIR